eukprot:UN16363
MNTAEPNPTAGANRKEGLKKRADFTANSQLMRMKAKLYLDIFNQLKPLVNNLRMVFILTRNTNAYVLMVSEAAAAYKIEVEQIYLNVRKVRSPTM